MIDSLAADKLRGFITAWIEQQNARSDESADRQCDQVLKRLALVEKRLFELEQRQYGGQQLGNNLNQRQSLFGP